MCYWKRLRRRRAAREQIRWALEYIERRYGRPYHAWHYWDASDL